ncbi:MAG: toxin-activating lysine-acyltransferase [Pseudomonadota bacterium]
MTQSTSHRGLSLSDLDGLAMRAGLLKQFRMFQENEMPIACVIWALAADDVVDRIRSGRFRLKPQEWRSGETPIVVEAIAPFGDSAILRDEIQEELERTRHSATRKQGAQHQ